MATMSFTVGALSYSKTIQAADVTRVQSAAKKAFLMPDAATNQEIVDALGKWMFSHLLGLVREQENRAAMQSVSDVPLT